MIKRILVGLGGTPYTASEVQHAIDIARVHDAQITAVTIIDLERVSNVGPLPIGASAAAGSLVQHRMEITKKAIDEAIESFQSECGKHGIKPQIVCEEGDPFTQLINQWRYNDITVLALRSLFEYGVVRDPKDMLVQLIAKGIRPILAVSKGHRPIKNVLVAYNGSMESAKALKQFVQLRIWPDANLRIVCCDLPDEQAKLLLNQSKNYCQAHGYQTETKQLTGSPKDAIPKEVASWPADLVVMGSTARARIFRHLLGDTALHMVKNSDIPLFMTQ